MKKYIPSLTEYIYENKQNEDAQIVSKDFGGDDSSKFLKIVWKMEINELEELLKKAEEDLRWLKKNSKGLFGQFNRRDAHLVKIRIRYLKEIIKDKTKDPTYIPDIHK